MKYLQLICIERESTAEEHATMRDSVDGWVRETIERGVNVVGKPLDDPGTARTVRVRDGQTLISDGPFAATKEFIGGLDILECENLDEAIEVASKHPVSWFHSIELRPFLDGADIPSHIDGNELRHLLMVCVDGIPEAPEVEAAIEHDAKAWLAELADSGAQVLSRALAPASSATTVRVRGGETLVSDGPFVETKEFLGGIDILSCETLDEAVDWAAKHPIARFHMVEVRRFIDL
jgi:hypothetical protein